MKENLSQLFLLLLCLFISTSQAYAQVATIDGVEINTEEFLYAFNKNRPEKAPISRDSLESYLDQFINFKLKIRAARELGLDTSEVFQSELQNYLSQIRKPYLENPDAEYTILRETYKRMQTDVNASHILLKLTPNASPKDTLEAFNFLDSLRQTIGSKTEFESLAKKYSQDGSAQLGGNLGWFTAMQMVEPFEKGAYATPKNKVSEIVRSSFGYHLIFVNDKRPNQGKIKTSHIFFSKQRGREAALQRATAVYDSLEKGARWDLMVRNYSDDQGTKLDAGRLPWASVKQLPDDFLEIAYEIDSIGTYTEPKETQFGWHIVKLDDKQELEPFEIKKDEISLSLKRMGRNNLQEDKLLEKLKAENQFEQIPESLENLLKTLGGKNKEQLLNSKLPVSHLFRLGNRKANTKNFIKTLPGFSISYNKEQLKEYYKSFEKQFILDYEDSIAPTKYPEYGFLRKEYEEGLLLFEVMQLKVWGKASEDSLGLNRFYQSNQNQYRIGERVQCLVVTGNNEKLISEVSKVNVPVDSLAHATQFITSQVKNSSQELNFAKRSLLATEFSNFKEVKNSMGQWFKPNSNPNLCLTLDILPAGIQNLEEIRGLVMSDYQEALDEQWIKELRNSAQIKVNKKELKKITQG